LARNFPPKLWREIFAGNFGGKVWREILAGNFGAKFWRENRVKILFRFFKVDSGRVSAKTGEAWRG
jgi:hypothetical protein